MTFYDTMIKYVAGILCKIYRTELVGAENLPDENTSCLLCANHINNMDPFVIGAAIRIKVYYMAKAELFKVPVVSQIIRAFGAFPVKRGSGDVGMMKKTIALIEDKKIVGMFPQGHRHPTENPRETELHHGAGMILWRSQACVLPVYIAAEGNRLRPFHKTKVIVGKVIPFEDLHLTEGNSSSYREATEYVFDKICSLGEQI